LGRVPGRRDPFIFREEASRRVRAHRDGYLRTAP
jgi:hypothetical protein